MAESTEKKDKNAVTRQQWFILISLMLGVFMGALDISIVSPAIPVIASKLSIPPRAISWIITLYLLVYVVATPLMSAMSDRFGRKRIFLINVAIFGIGSLVAALSTNLIHLLTARGIQALGAGGLFPIANTVVGEIFPRKRRGMALGFIGMVWGMAAIIGPPVGGWMTHWFGWASIFYVNVPLALIIIFFGARNIPLDKGVHSKPLDIMGMILLGAGLAGLTYGLNRIDSAHILSSLRSPRVWYWLAGALVVFGLFALQERKQKAAIVSVRLFRRRQLNIDFVLAFAGGMVEAGLVFLPYYIMEAIHVSTGVSGSLVLASAITLFIFIEPIGQLVDRIGVKPILIAGTAFTTLGAFLMTTADSVNTFIGYQVILAIGLSALLGTPIRYIALTETRTLERASAQSLISLSTSFGTMIGSTLAGAFLASNAHGLNGFHDIFWMVTAIALIGMFLSFGLKGKSPHPVEFTDSLTTEDSSSN